MNNLMKMVLSLSVSGSILALILFGIKFIFQHRMNRRWQYYIWLIVILRLLLPFSPKINFGDTIFSKIDSAITQGNLLSSEQSTEMMRQTGESDKKSYTLGNKEQKHRISEIFLENMWYIWLLVAGFMLIRKVTIYQSFVKYVKAGKTEVSDPMRINRLVQIANNIGIKRRVELYTNSLVSSPLLIGFFYPCIVLPTINLTEDDFDYTVLHELTHYRHGDMFYKWLVQVTVCLHWFNPFMHVIHKNIEHSCEFACDEAVIKCMDKNGRRKYGNTLVNALGVGGGYKSSLASVTLTENGRVIKERLENIMDDKKMTKKSIALMTSVTVFLSIGAVVIGAYFYTNGNSDRADTEKLDAYAEKEQISADMQQQLQETDGLTAYGYSGAGYMDISDSGVEQIYDDYKGYGLVRSDHDGSISFEGQRVREFIRKPEGWRYYDDAGTVDIYFDEQNKKIETSSKSQFEERTKVLSEYDGFCLSMDMMEEEPMTEKPETE